MAAAGGDPVPDRDSAELSDSDGWQSLSFVAEAPGLASLLRAQREPIREAWSRKVQELAGRHYRERSMEEVSRWAAQGLDAVISALESGSARPLLAHAREVGRVRGEFGFQIGEVIGGLLLLKEAALPYVLEARPSSPREIERLTAALDGALRVLVARFGQLYATAMRQSVEREKQRTALMLAAARAAGRSLELDVVLQRVVRCLAVALGSSYCGIFLVDSGGAAFVQHAASGEAGRGELPALLDRPLTAASDAVVATVLGRREPVLYRKDDPRPFLGTASCATLDVAAAVALPVLVGDRLLAFALALSFDDVTAFSAEQLQLATGIASAVAPALDHARLFAESRRRLNEINAGRQIACAVLNRLGLEEVLRLVCHETQQLIDASGVALLLLNDQGSLEVASSVGDVEENADRLLDELVAPDERPVPVEPLLLNEAEIRGLRRATNGAGLRSLLALPLRVRDKVIGSLQVFNKPDGFDEDDLRIAEAIADHAALAADHARLREQQERIAVLEERQRLARELHDSVTQSLYGVAAFAEAAGRLVSNGDLAGATSRLRELREATLNALWESRLLIFQLHPPAVEREGLVPMLQARLAAVEGRAGLHTELDCHGLGRLPRPIEESIYRIVQEALNNTLKHAQASTVSVSLTQTPEQLVLEIADDGVGFDLRTGKSKGGIGLRGMEERVIRMQGKMSIVTRPASGTRIRIELPLTTDARS